ncbi:DUF6183 family protein [Paenibacillus hamazuiensis]|uniref:DUF6183 family protein n=1 Tax=Paenibacillus hamazuiensis TaxID=2936508 RepID=UPI00200D3A0D|nr:DUF6183 family protein [Paenibacillus hamazuiensis]
MKRELELFQSLISEYAEFGYKEALSGQLLAMMREWAEQGQSEILLESVEWMEAHVRPKEQNWNGLNHLLDRLDMYFAQLYTGADALFCLLRLLTERRGAQSAFPRNPRSYNLRYYMALMAANRSAEGLHRILENAAEDRRVSLEAKVLLLYEMAARGKVDERRSVVRHVCDKAEAENHPLVWLPLTLTSLEEEISLMYYNRDGGGGHSTPFGPHRRVSEEKYRDTKARSADTGVAPSAFHPIHTDEELMGMQSAVRNWMDRSNGKTEAAVFDLQTRHEPDQIAPELLLSFGLTCLHGAPAEHVLLEGMRPARIFSLLYSAAANGGAYSSGDLNAYGRLEAWRSMGALAGAPDDADMPFVLKQAESCRWWYFEAPTPWFHHVAWDFGIAALRPDGRTLAVLAATDTD